jgi:flagellar biosynthesis protein FlhG
VLGPQERNQLEHQLRSAVADHDLLLIDLPAGSGADTLDFIGESDELLLVITPDPTSFLDAYVLVKSLAQRIIPETVSVICNISPGRDASAALFAEFARLIAPHLRATVLRHIGTVPEDTAMRRAVLGKRPCVVASPGAPASLAIRQLAAVVAMTDPALTPASLAEPRRREVTHAHG